MERLGRAGRRTKRTRQLRKAAAHTRNLALAGSNAAVLWGSEVLGFTLTQLRAIRVDAAKATYRLSRGQNAATTMMAHAQAAGAKNTDPAFRRHRQVVLAWATGVGKARQTSTQRRRRSEGRWPGSVTSRARGAAPRMRQPPSCSLFCGWAGARSLQGRPLGGGAEDGGFLGGSGFADVVRLEPFQGSAYLGSHQAASCFWQVGGVVTLASERAGQAGFLRLLDAGAALAAQGMRRRHLPALPRRSRHNVPPL